MSINTSRFDVVATLIRAVRDVRDRDAVADLIVAACADAASAEQVALFRAPGPDAVEVVSSRGLDQGAQVTITDVRSSFWSAVLGRATVRWADPAQGPPQLVRHGFAQGYLLRSSGPTGHSWLIAVSSTNVEPPGEDVALVQMLLDVGAVALERAELAWQVERAEGVVRHVAGLAGSLGGAVTPDGLLKGVAEGLTELDHVLGVVVWTTEPSTDGDVQPRAIVEVLPPDLDWDDSHTRQRLQRMLDPQTHKSIKRLVGMSTRSPDSHAWSTLIPIPAEPPIVMGLLHAHEEDDLARSVFASLADTVGPALREVRAAAERRSLLASFVRGLRPRSIPAWLDVGVEYHPNATEELFGGDFYDLVEISGGAQAMVVLGDVTGKGVRAASTAAAVVWSLRAMAAQGAGASMVLTLIDRAVSATLDPEQFVTIAAVSVDSRSWTARVSLAGHPPPLLLRADGTVEEVAARPGPPLGVLSGMAVADAVDIPLAPGEAVALYTDGTTEARLPQGGRLGLAPLMDALRIDAEAGGAAGDHAGAMWRAVRDRTGGAPDDDCAIVVVRRPADP